MTNRPTPRGLSFKNKRNNSPGALLKIQRNPHRKLWVPYVLQPLDPPDRNDRGQPLWGVYRGEIRVRDGRGGLVPFDLNRFRTIHVIWEPTSALVEFTEADYAAARLRTGRDDCRCWYYLIGRLHGQYTLDQARLWIDLFGTSGWGTCRLSF